MRLTGIRVDIKNDNCTRIKLTKALPNGNTFVRYTNQGEKKEFCKHLEQFAIDYNNKLKTI